MSERLVLKPSWRVAAKTVAPADQYVAEMDLIARENVSDVKRRVTALEEALAGQNRRIDRIELWLDRIERRLMLMDLRG